MHHKGIIIINKHIKKHRVIVGNSIASKFQHVTIYIKDDWQQLEPHSTFTTGQSNKQSRPKLMIG